MKIFCVFLALAALTSGCSRTPKVREINIASVHKGWGAEADSLKIITYRDRYWANGREVRHEIVEDLCSAAFARSIPKPELQNLRITRHWLDAVAIQALNSFEKDYQTKLNQQDRRLFVSSFHNKKLIQQAIETEMLPHTDDFPKMTVNITLENNQQLQLLSSSQSSYMLPWTIKKGGSSLLTFDSTIARSLAAIVPPTFVNANRLNDVKFVSDVMYYITKYNKRILMSHDPRREIF